MKRWAYDFNASGCWIVDADGFTVAPHMPITVEQVKEIVREHNRMIEQHEGNREPEIAAMSVELENHHAFQGDSVKSGVWATRLWEAAHKS